MNYQKSVIDDRATIVSLFPLELTEFKPNLNPGIFRIPACTDINNPVLFHVLPAVHNVYLGENRNFPVENSAFTVASAIVRDLITSMIECSEGCTPGFLSIPKYIDNKITLEKEYFIQLKELRNSQVAWYRKLYALAEDSWSNNHQYQNISDIQRVAAKELNYSPDWLTVSQAVIPVKCPACTSLISPEALICPMCKTLIKSEEYKAKFKVV